jgi:hypothetical protein
MHHSGGSDFASHSNAGTRGDQVARTGLAVVKLQDRAREVPTNEYDEEIQAGLDYIFGQATIDPYDPVEDSGICFAQGGHETYSTGIAMMAIANDGDLSQVVSAGVLNGKTYGQILVGNVDFFAYTQNPLMVAGDTMVTTLGKVTSPIAGMLRSGSATPRVSALIRLQWMRA